MNSKMKNEELGEILPPLFGDLRPQDRVECAELEAAPNQILWGKYFLCQTISTTTATGTKGVGLQVAVTDSKGVAVLRLDLYNYSSTEKSALGLKFDDILPPGSFLVLKNPWYEATDGGTLRLRCDNPAQVELVSWKRLEAKFPELSWNGNKTIQLPQRPTFWSDFKDDEAAFAKLKDLGNKGFVDKRFSDAIRFYDMALEYCAQNQVTEAMLHSNKSAALLALGCYNTALKCAEFALEVVPSNEKYSYRKTKALIGLRKYEEALSFLGGKFQQFPSFKKNKDCKNLLDIVKFLCSRETLGPTKSQLLSIRTDTLEKDANVPEFTGPLTISKIEGKGRGLVATEDIATGQLLICAKAFAYHAHPPTSNHGIIEETPSAEQIVSTIANKLTFDPELGPELYNLTAGAELGHLGPGDSKVGHVDTDRILEIVKLNAYRSEVVVLENGEATEFTGVWILPSFLNHSCSEFNCLWFFSGEFLTLTAIAEIKKGEELTISCISPLGSYSYRSSSVKKLRFVCGCKLCQLDASEPISVSNERAKILKSLEQLSADCGSREIKKALKGAEKLISFRKHNVPLNFPLLSPQVFKLTEILINKGRLGDSISLLSRMHQVASASVFWSSFGKEVMVNLLVAHAFRGDEEGVEVWMDNLKALAVKMHGGLEFSGVPYEDLKEMFGIDFFE